jgi:hypothetical protein
MPHFRRRPTVFWSLPFLIFLGGCDAKPECDSFETRNAVLKTVSDDHKMRSSNTPLKIRLWRNRVTRAQKLKNQNNSRHMF